MATMTVIYLLLESWCCLFLRW